MKKFDFDHPEFLKHSPAVQDFFRTAYKSELEMEEFVKLYKKYTTSAGRPPSMLRGVYKRLKTNFKFFI